MESSRPVLIPVTLKGMNYLLWSRMVKTSLGGRGLASHLTSKEAPLLSDQTEENQAITVVNAEKWTQEDQLVLSILQSSLDNSILEAYSYCESAKDLWDTLQRVYGNISNISRVYEVKKAINQLMQEDNEFNAHFGQYRSLWAELEMLRPSSVDPAVILERQEQDKVFGLLFSLNSTYTDLIKHILRSEKLPSLEEVCAQIQREQGSLDLFSGKGDMVTAHKGVYLKSSTAKKKVECEHCKGTKHTKEQCWLLHPHLKPKWPVGFPFRGGRAGWSRGRADSRTGWARGRGDTSSLHNTNDRALATAQSPHSQDDVVKRSDLDAILTAIKENYGNIVGKTLHASFNAFDVVHKPLIVDSGASHHMISDVELISNLEPALGTVTIANGDRIPIQGIGNLKLFEKESKAFYIPKFTSNLLSVQKATTDLDCNVIFTPNDVLFQDIKTSKLLGKGTTKEGLYVLKDIKSLASDSYSLQSSVANSSAALWHARLGHPHSRALKLMLPNVMFQNDACEACVLGKHCRSVFQPSQTIYDKCFDLVHSDVWTSPCSSRENQKYFVTFIDEKSKYTWITLLQSKDRVLDAFTQFHTYVTNHFNAKIKVFRTDNGGEYTSRAFVNHLNKHGILHQTSCPYTPQQNGVAERKNRHLMEVARSMMFYMQVPKRFWGDAVLAASYLINRIPTKVLHDLSPFEVLNSTKPSLDHLRVFGCVCFVFTPDGQRNKLDAKSTRGMFLGYSTTQKGYKCYIPDSRKVLISRDVKFMEDKSFFGNQKWEDIQDLTRSPPDLAKSLRFILDSMNAPSSAPAREGENQGGRVPEQVPGREHEDIGRGPGRGPEVLGRENEDAGRGPEVLGRENEDAGREADQGTSEAPYSAPDSDIREPEVSNDGNTNLNNSNDEIEIAISESPQVLRRSTRIRRDPSNWINTRVYYNAHAVAHPNQGVCSFATFPLEHQAFISKLDQSQIPRNYEEAMQLKVWRDAVQAEREAMERNQTWVEADLPNRKKAVSSKWVFTIKYKSNGDIERYKARLVARGFTQTYGEDFGDTFAPVAKLHTVRIVLSLAANLEWELCQMDVKNAFLQGELEEEVYMTPPPGLENSVSQGKVLRLRKAIYGLKQSPRAWYHKLSVTLRDRGFRKSEADHTLFILSSNKGMIVVLVYVDDIIITGNYKEGIESTKSYLKSMFDIKDLGSLKYFLGIEICRSKEGLFLSQRKYTLELLDETGLQKTKSVSTPLEESYKVVCKGESEDQSYHDPKQYRRLVGKLIYLTLTRPDICFAVNQVSQHMQSPKVHHWNMLERVLRYLSGTTGFGIWMGCNGSSEIVGYCDADWAGDREDRRSTTGYCTFVGGNLVTWRTKKQKVVSCSSAEAEYRAMRKLVTELAWIKAVLKDMEIETAAPITMHCDNQAAIHIASNSVFHERTKHIEVDCHKVRQAVELGLVLPCYTKSSDQLADIFTKSATPKVCESILPRLGLIDLAIS